MLAATRTKYGSPDVISVREVEVPTPGDKEVLIRVHAATVNRTDCAILSGKPFIMKLATGLFKPKLSITGTDFAGEIVTIGSNVRAFKTGDKVFGFDDMGLRSHARYMTLAEHQTLMKMPDGFTFAEAAASIEGAHYALNFINKVTLKSGQKILVNGASGAIGSALVQILKSSNTEVTAVCSTRNLELVKSLGADKVIDFTQQDFTAMDERFDFVFDAVGKSSFGKCKSLLNLKGIYISSELGDWSQNIFFTLFTPLTGAKKVIFPFPTDIPASLTFMKNLMEQKKFKPVVDRTYPLEKIADAYRYVATGHKTGNVMIAMDE